VRYLVVGTGSIGQRHIKNLLRLEAGEVTAFDLSPERRGETVSQFGIAVFDDLDKGLAARPDAVLVTTPPDAHVEVASRAARAGCHLFIEKPLSHRLDGLDELERLVADGNLVSLVGCNLRFHPALAEAKRLVATGAVGRVVAVMAQFGQYLPTWHPWEDYRRMYSAHRNQGGGVILDAIHEVDYVRWMLGEVAEVACFADKLSDLDLDVEDTAALVLRFESGAIGEIHLDYVQRDYSRNCTLIGDGGTIRCDLAAAHTSVYTEGTGRWDIACSLPDWDVNEMYVDELRHFTRCLSGLEQSVCDIRQGRRVLQVALAARLAAQTRTVERPEDMR
jgi:predicted dehydrogenase